MSEVAVIGLGRMGRPMALHFAEHGFRVTGFDVDSDALAWADAHSVSVASSPKGAAESADIILVITGTEDQVRDAVLGPAGVFQSARQGSTTIIGSTVSPQLVRELAELGQRDGLSVLDAPCTRGERGAIEGNLLWLVGGDTDVVDRCRSFMEACGPDIFHLGPVGSGQIGKAINNMLLWAALCADHEALVLAQRCGLDGEELRKALTKSSASNWALEHWEDMKNIPWAVKDMEIVLRMADGVGLQTPLAGLIRTQVATHVRNAGWSV